MSCPLCKKLYLNLQDNVIFCECGLRVDTRSEEEDLAYFKNSLCESIHRHSTHCNHEVRFEVACVYEIFVLYVKCESCGFSESAI